MSTVVTTLLIILLVLIAVGIVWVVVKNVIQGGSEQISLGKVTLDLEISQAQKNALNNSELNLTVKRNTGEGEFVGIAFVIDDGENTEVIKKIASLEELGTQRFSLYLENIDVSKIKKISIAPIFKLESGKEVVGDIKDEYSGSLISEVPTCTICPPNAQCGKNSCGEECGTCTHQGDVCSNYQCVQDLTCLDTCLSLGYTCGVKTICGKNINCGNCLTGYECNSNGSCSALCVLTSAKWNMTEVLTGQQVKLNISGTNCNGKTISFKIWEKDGGLWDGDDEVTSNPSNILFNETNYYSIWNSVFLDDSSWGQSNPPEYYFTASVVGTTISLTSSKLDTDMLKVSQPILCGDGICSVNSETCSTCSTDCGNCPPVCGNSIIEGTEQCDCGPDKICNNFELNGQTCLSKMGTGYVGTLNCTSSCTFNTGLCLSPCTNTCYSLGYKCGNQNVCGQNVYCGTCSLANAFSQCNSNSLCEISSCNSGYSNCDRNEANGCEIQLGTNSNCGLCGNVCSTGYACSNNICVSSTPTCFDGIKNGAETGID